MTARGTGLDRRGPRDFAGARAGGRSSPPQNKKKRRRFAATPFSRKLNTPNQSAFQGGLGRRPVGWRMSVAAAFPGTGHDWVNTNTVPNEAFAPKRAGRRLGCPGRAGPGRQEADTPHKNVGPATIWSETAVFGRLRGRTNPHGRPVARRQRVGAYCRTSAPSLAKKTVPAGGGPLAPTARRAFWEPKTAL